MTGKCPKIVLFVFVQFHNTGTVHLITYHNLGYFDEWIVFVVVTKSYDIFFQNWKFHYEKLKLDMRLIVIAEDDFIYEKYQDQNDFTLIKSDYNQVCLISKPAIF